MSEDFQVAALERHHYPNLTPKREEFVKGEVL